MVWNEGSAANERPSARQSMTAYRVGLDIGGTFTDFVLYDGEHRRIALHKCLTTPHDPSLAAHDLIQDLKWDAGLRLRFAQNEAGARANAGRRKVLASTLVNS